jgi:pimeloyl-ACP methyl ester carboxylesterase
VKLPVTAFVRVRDPEAGLKTGKLRGRLELYTTDSATTVTIGGRTVPLEFDLSSALASTLEGSKVYSMETKGFFSGNLLLFKDEKRFKESIFFMSPYRPGRIPVVMIHGTASSSARWAQMLNELQNDRRLWGRYQFWAFTYNTGNPILYSGGLLTEGLKEVVRGLDPDGADPALKNMVIIGHSQGGMLTKLTAIDSGTRFWDSASKVPFDRIDVSPDTREMLRKSFIYTPLPFVKRVVFISTPHRGSYVAGGWIGRFAGRFVSLPFRMLDVMKEVVSLNPKAVDLRSLKAIPKSTENMDPNSQFVKTFSSMPIAPGIPAHSIISVENWSAPKERWTDGVVKYESAHIDDAASELIVHSGHSTQSEPHTIEEVRRILLLHIGIQ